MNRKNLSADMSIFGRLTSRSMVYVALCIGGLATGSAVASSDFHWAAWIGLIPIFAAIRRLSGMTALIGGALWGAAVYIGAIAASRTVIPVAFSAFILYIILPAAYVYSMALFSRRYWYSSLAMALGWIIVELIINLSGIRPGLISAEHIDSPILRVIADFLGSGFIAFFIAYTGAVVISLVSHLGIYWRSAPSILSRYPEFCLIDESYSPALHGRRMRPVRPRGPPHAGRACLV